MRDYILQGSSLTTVDILTADERELAASILAELSNSESPINQSPHNPGAYTCTRTAGYEASWFCGFANSILATRRETQTPTARWVCTKDCTLGGKYKDVGPDFFLTASAAVTDIPWSSVLVVGHLCPGLEFPLLAIVQTAEKIFQAQPFRTAVIGVLMWNTTSEVRFWRLDRAGAVMSFDLDYSASAEQLFEVVLCLHTLPKLSASALGFHTKSILWEPVDLPYPQGENCRFRDSTNAIVLDKLVFAGEGLTTRGTRVWKGHLRASGKVTVIKYCWRSSCRPPEALAYEAAKAHGVIGIARFISSDFYERITGGVRRGFTAATDIELNAYHLSLAQHDRILTRLVLGTSGTPLSCADLSPLEVAHGLLAGFLGHASLLFEAGFLHRDISPQNILYCHNPIPILNPRPELSGNQRSLRGCIIDLDFAIEVDKIGVPEFTGTYPFIAIDIMKGTCAHRYRHDLESFFYVLVWIACYPAVAPAPPLQSRIAPTPSQSLPASTNTNPEPTSDDLKDLWPHGNPLAAWCLSGKQHVASLKRDSVVTSCTEFEELLARFRSGFEPFRDAARSMRKVLWHYRPDICLVFRENMEGTAVEEDPGMQESGVWVRPDEVRPGVGNFQAFTQMRGILERLVQSLGEDLPETSQR